MMKISFVCFIVLSHAVPISAGPSILMIGDWGGHNDSDPTTAAQLEISNGMGSVGATLGVKTVILLGDNFYSQGVDSAVSPRFNETFEQVYPPVFGPGTQFWAIAGNHDHKQNVTAQIEYSGMSENWNFPYFYYNKSWSWAGEDGTERSADLLLLDTAILCGESDVYDETTGTWRALTGAELPGPFYPEAAKAQWEWLEAALEASTADFLWVGGHYPIYSAGNDGTTPLLVAKLLPLLSKHGAHYISGHDHMFEHIVAPQFPDTQMFLAGVRTCSVFKRSALVIHSPFHSYVACRIV